jgi:hypothetical protein
VSLILHPGESAADAIRRQFLTPVRNHVLQIDHLHRTIDKESKGLSPFQKKVLWLRLEHEVCRTNRYYFMTHHARTLDPRAEPGDEVKPVPDLRYIYILNCIEEAFPHTVAAKSRQIFFTWLFTIMKLHKAMYRPARKIFFHTLNEAKAGFGSPGEPDTSCMLGRALFVYDRLPLHLQTPGPHHGGRSNKSPQSLTFFHYDPSGAPVHSTIYAVSDNPEIMASYTATDVLNDEVSKQRKAKAFYGTAQPALGRTGCMNNLFTPMGLEFGHDLLMNLDRSDDEGRRKDKDKEPPPFQELMPLKDLYHGAALEEITREGSTSKVPLGPRFHVRMNPNRNLAMKVWWRADPSKDKDWADEEFAHQLAWYVRREYEIDFSALEGQHPLWQITDDNMKTDLRPDDRFPLYRIWDFGIHAAVLICQAIVYDRPFRWVQARVLSEVDVEGKNTSSFARIVKEHTTKLYGIGRFAIKDICDVAGRHRSALAENINMTHIKLVKEATGINITTHHKVPRFEGTETIGLKINERVDGQPGFVINPVEAPILSAAMSGGHVAMNEFGEILDNRATEWLIHTCYSADTEMLTADGWKRFDQVSVGDEVATLNPSSGFLEYQRTTARIWCHYKGDMIEVNNKLCRLLVTPDHRMYSHTTAIHFKTRTRGGRTKEYVHTVPSRRRIIMAKDLTTQDRLVTRASWQGKDQDTVVIPAFRSERRNYPEVRMDAGDYYEFIGWYLAEGWVSHRKPGRQQKEYEAGIAAMGPRDADLIEPLLFRLPWKFSFIKGRGGYKSYGAQLWHLLEPIGNSRTKRIPRDLLAASSRLLDRLWLGYVRGDGWLHYSGRYRMATVSEGLLDDLQEVALKTGRALSKFRRNVNPIQVIGEHSARCQTQFWGTEKRTPFILLHDNKGRKNTRAIPYDGYVGCVSTPNGIIFVRRGPGYPVWCGNCDAARYWAWHVLKRSDIIGSDGKKLEKPAPQALTADDIFKNYNAIRTGNMRKRFLKELELRRKRGTGRRDPNAF